MVVEALLVTINSSDRRIDNLVKRVIFFAIIAKEMVMRFLSVRTDRKERIITNQPLILLLLPLHLLLNLLSKRNSLLNVTNVVNQVTTQQLVTKSSQILRLSTS